MQHRDEAKVTADVIIMCGGGEPVLDTESDCPDRDKQKQDGCPCRVKGWAR